MGVMNVFIKDNPRCPNSTALQLVAVEGIGIAAQIIYGWIQWELPNMLFIIQCKLFSYLTVIDKRYYYNTVWN